MMLDEGSIFKSLQYIYLMSAIALIAVIAVFMFLFIYIIRKITQADHLKVLSETDQLTGINNRGAGEQKIIALMKKRESGMFALLDADHFKSVNDTFGHDVGDKVIIAIADCLKHSFRDSDIIMRLGGDEFAFYAKNVTDTEIGRMLVDRFFHAIDGINIPELGDRKICVSIGASFYTGDDCNFEKIYKKADEGAYQSKKTQGNQITFN